MKSDIQRVQKLINIAKPIELPPLKMETATADTTQPKKSLPLFGKKKTFGFDKLKLQVATKQPTALSDPSKTSAGESIEEFDDDEDGNEASVKLSKISNAKTESAEKAASTKPNKNDDDDTSNKEESESCAEPAQHFAKETRAEKISPSKEKEEEICKEEEKAEIHEHKESMDSEQHVNASNVQSSFSSSSGGNNKQKSKNRQRNKKRFQIDIDDTEEDTSPQKYSGWMPPDNQTGDGMTQLNSKYGY